MMSARAHPLFTYGKLDRSSHYKESLHFQLQWGSLTVGIVDGGFQSVRYGIERGASFAAYEIAIPNGEI
jgi:hypothetical protein